MKTSEAWRSSEVESECPYCGEVDAIGYVDNVPETWHCGCGKEYIVGDILRSE